MNWQPIETAPKDGTMILVHGPYGFLIVHWGNEANSGWHGEDGEWPEYACTHWMPLPEPPCPAPQ